MKNIMAYLMALFSLFFMGAWVVSAQTDTVTPSQSPTVTETPSNQTPSGAPQTGFGTKSR